MSNTTLIVWDSHTGVVIEKFNIPEPGEFGTPGSELDAPESENFGAPLLVPHSQASCRITKLETVEGFGNVITEYVEGKWS